MKIKHAELSAPPDRAHLQKQTRVGTAEQSRLEAYGFYAMVFAACLALLGCVAFISQANVVLSRYDDHRRTAEISGTLLNIASNIHAMETGKQGYLLTGSDRFMAPYQQGGLELRKNIGLLDSLIPPEDGAGKSLIARLRQLMPRQEFANAGLHAGIDIAGNNDAQRAQVQAVISELNAGQRKRQATADATSQTLVQEAKYLFLAWTMCIAFGFGLALRYGARARTLLRQESQKLSIVAHYDSLTGLPNRRFLDDYLATAFARSVRYGSQLTLLYFDLDGFSGINNVHGHEAGDAALVWTCETVRTEIRQSDFFARLGGDEFVVVSDGTSVQQAENLAARLLARFAAGRPIEGVRRGALGLSIGIAGRVPEDPDVKTLLARADHAMYEAKDAGKRCWRVAQANKGPAADEFPARRFAA